VRSPRLERSASVSAQCAALIAPYALEATAVAEVSTVSTAWAVFSAIGGSLIGALIGGVTSYSLQRRSLRATKAQRDEDRFEDRKALGYSLLVKMIRLTSDLHTLGKSIRTSVNAAADKNFKHLFQAVLPIAPLPDPVTFDSDELALLLSIDSELFNQIGSLDELHKSTVALFDLYNKRRTSVLERFSAHAMEGNVGTTMLTQEQVNWLAPRAVELNMLVQAMLDRTERDGQEAWDALEKLHAALQLEFKLKHKLERRPPEKSEVKQ